MPSSSAIRSPQVLAPLIAVAVAGALIAWQPPPLLMAAMLVAVIAAVAVMTIDASRVFEAYLIYLGVEGSVKIFTNYNPVVHVGSDLLLLLVVARLWARQGAEGRMLATPAVARVVPLLTVFWMWVFLQFMNPWGLGLLPSLAALKIYLVPILVFFVVGYLLRAEELKRLPFLLVVMGLFMAAAAIVDGLLGENYLPRLNPGYGAAMMGRFSGILYRPFGFTALPGGPGVWMVHIGTAVGLLLYQLQKEGATMLQGNQLWQKPWFWRAIVGVFLVAAVITLLLCQVRSSLIRFLIIIMGGFLGFGMRGFMRWIGGITIAAVLVAGVFHMKGSSSVGGMDVKRVTQISDRFTSLSKTDTWKSARKGAWDAMVELSESTVLGIGLSRVGAASRIWSQQIAQDRMFGPEWSFADNVYRALFTEIGLGGLFAWLLLVGGIIVLLLQRGTREGRLVALCCVVYLVVGFASEGILYQPDASFFWLYVAYGLRSDAGGLV